MQVQEVAPNVLVFVGQSHHSVATAFVSGQEAILVDTLAGADDSQLLFESLCGRMGKRVRAVVVTHYMSDHLGGLHLYKGAEVIAHAHHMHTYFSQGTRESHVERHFVRPDRVIHDGLDLVWGGKVIRIFHNPGHTVSTLNIDVPALDLLLTSDNLVGHIAYLSSSAPDMLDGALSRIEQLGRRLLVSGHLGVQAGEAAHNARDYLRRLAGEVQGCRDESGVLDAALMSLIPVEKCRVGGYALTDFEREWHGYNLDVIGARDLFPLGNTGKLEPLASLT
jgi:cyclase